MADLEFKETCPCGDTVEVRGSSSAVEKQVEYWRLTHVKHSNVIARETTKAKQPQAVEITLSPQTQQWFAIKKGEDQEWDGGTTTQP